MRTLEAMRRKKVPAVEGPQNIAGAWARYCGFRIG